MILKENKAITLIALVITIVVLLIIATIAINLTLGENGIIGRAKDAAALSKKAKYYQEIDLEIASEKIERSNTNKEETFAQSIKTKIEGKDWVKNVIICDESGEENIEDAYLNTILIVETTDNYEIFIDLDNYALTATIRENSFAKMEDKCIVKYDTNGAEGTYEEKEVRKGFYITLAENISEKEDYEFTGWCLDKNGEGTKYSSGNKIKIDSDTTFYATWNRTFINVTFYSNGGTGTMNASKIAISSDTQLPNNAFSKSYYTFAKWNTKADGTGTNYNNAGVVNLSDDIELYAQWTPTVYSISYNLNGGSITNQRTSYTIETDTFTLVTPTSSLNSFKGWTGSNGSTPQTSVQISKGSYGNLSYTANWNNDGTIAVGQTITYGSYTFTVRVVEGTTVTMTPNNGISSLSLNNGETTYNNLETVLNNACSNLFNGSANKSQLTIRSIRDNERTSELVVKPTSSSTSYWMYKKVTDTKDGVKTYGCSVCWYSFDIAQTVYYAIYDETGKKYSYTCAIFPVVTFDKSILTGLGSSWRLT